MMSNICKFIGSLLLWACCVASPSAQACTPAPGNEYEKVYCQLKRSGKGEALPSLYDFRKNPPLTQAYLLKKPAERAGIPLRIPERGNAETVDRQSELLMAVEGIKAAEPVPAPDKKKAAGSLPVKPVTGHAVVNTMVAQQVAVSDPMAGCLLRSFELHCPGMSYRLVTNESNDRLRAGVLSEEHHLGLMPYTGQDRDDYLRQAYARYAEGMMEIGLGASTMSYTKFVHLFDHITGQKLDFAQRFETMYHFLKEDKTRIGVNTKPVIADGFTTRYCSDLKPGLLACEHQRDNYLFVALQVP